MPRSLEKIREIVDQIKTRRHDTPAAVMSSMIEIKSLLEDLLLHVQVKSMIDQISSLIGDKPVVEAQKPVNTGITLQEALDNLEKIATNRKLKSGKREFLLHRPTEDHEYAESIQESREYETSEPTEWMAKYMPAEGEKNGPNPVVSCWIPEDSVQEIPHPHANTGTWGEMGENPFADQYSVIVKPGKYELYQEYKGK